VRRTLLLIAILAVLTILVYSLNIASNQFVLLIPIVVLAVFQLTEKNRKDR
jgi:hypothetical protein